MILNEATKIGDKIAWAVASTGYRKSHTWFFFYIKYINSCRGNYYKLLNI